MPLLVVDVDGEEEMNIRSRARSVVPGVIAAGVAATLLSGSLLAAVPRAGAQEPAETPVAERGARRIAFLERLATLLGVDLAQLQQAIEDARLEMIDEALASGRITEQQAERRRDRAESGKPPRVRDRRARHAQIRAGIVETAAGAIGVTPGDLRASLRDGDSIADVAAAHNVPLDDVKTAILDAAKVKLDAAVANGRIGQPRADAMLADLESRLDDLLNKTRQVPATP
jgi:hypothetical protein